MEILKPTPQLLIKLGSIIVHYKEYLSPDGHALDLDAINALMDDEDVKEWMAGMDKMAFLPKMRK